MNTYDFATSRTIAAAPETVYDAFLDPKCPGGFWAVGERTILDPVVDGLFYWAVDHENRIYAHYGRFVALERGRRAEFTWMSEPTHGLETTVRVTFAPDGRGTKVTLSHIGLPDDDAGHGHDQGWTSLLAGLAEHLDKVPAG